MYEVNHPMSTCPIIDFTICAYRCTHTIILSKVHMLRNIQNIPKLEGNILQVCSKQTVFTDLNVTWLIRATPFKGKPHHNVSFSKSMEYRWFIYFYSKSTVMNPQNDATLSCKINFILCSYTTLPRQQGCYVSKLESTVLP